MGPNEHDRAMSSAEPPSAEPPGTPPAQPDAGGMPDAKPEEPGEAAGEKRGRSPEEMVRDAVAGGKKAFGSLGVGMACELKKPTTGAAIAGGLVVGSAIAVGAAETAVGALAAYVVYRTMKKK